MSSRKEGAHSSAREANATHRVANDTCFIKLHVGLTHDIWRILRDLEIAIWHDFSRN